MNDATVLGDTVKANLVGLIERKVQDIAQTSRIDGSEDEWKHFYYELRIVPGNRM